MPEAGRVTGGGKPGRGGQKKVARQKDSLGWKPPGRRRHFDRGKVQWIS